MKKIFISILVNYIARKITPKSYFSYKTNQIWKITEHSSMSVRIIQLTDFPFSIADLVFLKPNTFPQMEISLQIPGWLLPNPLGFIRRMPFVVSPSIMPPSICHLGARSPRKMLLDLSNPAHFQLFCKIAICKLEIVK